MQQSFTKIIEGRFVYSCSFQKQHGYEQFVPEYLLAYQISGETHVQNQNGTLILKAGQLLLARRNQLTKSLKFPEDNQPYKVVSVVFPVEVLQQFAIENQIVAAERYRGPQSLIIEPDSFFKSYFNSLLPYVEHAESVDKQLGILKTTEALRLLIRLQPELTGFLFDFKEPCRADLKQFMLENYRYNIPVEIFARLTGRSLASFKREFKTFFDIPPRRWLLEKRLSEACVMIEQSGKKPSEVYLELGFENLSHFYKIFKHKYGVTPANYRSQQ